MLELDLEHYDFGRGSTSLIRPTEGTMVERLAPRIEVRRGAELEPQDVRVRQLRDAAVDAARPRNEAVTQQRRDRVHRSGWRLVGDEAHAEPVRDEARRADRDGHGRRRYSYPLRWPPRRR